MGYAYNTHVTANYKALDRHWNFKKLQAINFNEIWYWQLRCMVILGIENVETLQTIADTCNANIRQCNWHISITQSVLIKKTKRPGLFISAQTIITYHESKPSFSFFDISNTCTLLISYLFIIFIFFLVFTFNFFF